MIQYFKLGKDLFRFNSKYPEFYRKNKIKIEDKLEFSNLERIGKIEYNRLMNERYKTIHERWEFNGEFFKNLPCFETFKEYFQLDRTETNNFITRTVYHQGDVYQSYDNDNSYGTLILMQDGKYVKRTSYKNCAPIQNLKTKKII